MPAVLLRVDRLLHRSEHHVGNEPFFRLPFETMDLLWYGQEHNVPLEDVAQALGLTTAQVQRAFNDFTRKQRSTEYLRMEPLDLVERTIPETIVADQ